MDRSTIIYVSCILGFVLFLFICRFICYCNKKRNAKNGITNNNDSFYYNAPQFKTFLQPQPLPTPYYTNPTIPYPQTTIMPYQQPPQLPVYPQIPQPSPYPAPSQPPPTTYPPPHPYQSEPIPPTILIPGDAAVARKLAEFKREAESRVEPIPRTVDPATEMLERRLAEFKRSAGERLGSVDPAVELVEKRLAEFKREAERKQMMGGGKVKKWKGEEVVLKYTLKEASTSLVLDEMYIFV
ncbi:hypothetical protein BC829DRAFT_431800 [Chytridium lagenaria]|nr:hypothetical protein BC829DRAFT_431800 [Chytridium lagenaria]